MAERPADGSGGANQRQLAKSGGGTREASVLARIDDGRRHGEVEGAPFFGQLCRREVDGHLAAREVEAAVVDGDLHPLTGFLEGAIAESHDVKPGKAVGNVGLHLNPDTVEAEDRPGKGPGQHQGRYYTSLYICVS